MDDSVTLRPPPVCTGRGGRLLRTEWEPPTLRATQGGLHVPDMGVSFMASCLFPTSKTRRHYQEGAWLRGSLSPPGQRQVVSFLMTDKEEEECDLSCGTA